MRFALFLLALTSAAPAAAFDLNEKVSLGGVASWAGQCQRLGGDDGQGDHCRGALPLEPYLNLRPARGHDFFFRLGFAAGNGLNDVTVFNVAPWAASLHEDVKDINGTNRDYLLTAWYRYQVEVQGGRTLGVTVGLVDATDYMDENAYSNDEYTQFMNAALVNGPNALLPSFAPGLALRYQGRHTSWTGVYMNVGRPGFHRFDFLGAQFGYHAETGLGPGNYRILVGVTSAERVGQQDTSQERNRGAALSLDQRFGEHVGGFLRLANLGEGGALEYRSLSSGGVDLRGTAWDRPGDNLGVAFAYLTGGDGEVRRTRTAEVYYRFGISEHLGISPDIQYMVEDLVGAPRLQGFIFGVRVTARY